MQIGEKRTTLKDNAAIYNHKTDNMTDREKFKSLSAKGKWVQFKQYYLLKIVAFIAIGCFVVSLLYTMLKPRKEVVFFAAVSDATMNPDMVETVQKGFEERLAINPEKQETVFDDGFYLLSGDYQQNQRYTVMLYAAELSAAILPESVFQKMAPNNHFAPMSEVLPTGMYLEFSDKLAMSSINDSKGETVSDSEKAYGIYIDSSAYFKDYNYPEPIVLAVPASWKNREVCADFIEFLLK